MCEILAGDKSGGEKCAFLSLTLGNRLFYTVICSRMEGIRKGEQFEVDDIRDLMK